MNAIDTNVLIYAHDPRDPVKQQRAVAADCFADRWRVAVAGSV
jgi:hypothetical protein